MHVTRVLVVYKKSYYELYGYAAAAVPERQRPFVEALRLSHLENAQTLAAVRAALEALGLAYDCLYRGQLKRASGYDLLISVGGDGTFLEVARHAGHTPVLGVNSDPTRSTAFFCAADRFTIRACLEAWLAGALPEVRLARLQAAINDAVLPYYALNDVLFAHANPAAMSSYILELEGVSEAQKSSGVWIATAAGSTAAMRAAGGRLLPLRSRRMQYRVREPYRSDGCPYRLRGGILPPQARLVLISRMRRGRLFMDGPHLRFPLGLGDVLTVTAAPLPLRVLGLRGKRRR
ncbi:MAG: hypothetical protein KatS3mg131_2078 [Candidatus Tectimicrobiota bacterium]|nr:MAG: hypothetical protein KatS3mg131_2078 [Candidatus Tectomicrobia bacterium]